MLLCTMVLAARPVLALEDGQLLERGPCPVISEPAGFAKALDDYYREDIEIAKLDAELAAQPLSTIFTEAENQRLVEASRSGRCERITYGSGGLRVTGFLLRPESPGPHPVLVYLRGGVEDFGQIEPVTLLNLKWFADAGFVVLATQYRGVDGGEGADEVGGADLDDVAALVPLARSLPDADATRLFVLGGSRGAMEAMMAVRRGFPARAVALRGAMVDLGPTFEVRPDMRDAWTARIPDYARDAQGAILARSPLQWASEIRTPVLMLHGRQDWRTALGPVEQFDAALAAAGTAHKLVVYDHDEHQLALHRQAWLAEVLEWFRQWGAFEP